MKIRYFLPLVSMALTSVVAANGTDTHPRIDSDMTFSFVITMEGEEKIRGTQTIAKFDTARISVREVLLILAEIQAVEASEGADNPPKFPSGSRLVAKQSGEVWVVDRSREFVFDASPYVSFSINRPDGVTAGNSDATRGQIQATTLAEGRLTISYPGTNAEAAEGGRRVSDFLDVTGQLNERYSFRANLRSGRSSETESISGRMSGEGSLEGNYGRVDGSIRLNGRQTNQEL